MSNVAQMAAAKPAARFFNTTQSLKEQIAIFGSLVKTATKNGAAHVHLITPQLADWLLQNRNGGNRRRSETAIQLYTEAMEEHDWPVTGATIVISEQGRVLDGQHRLIACVRSGEPFHTYIVFHIDHENFDRIDTGRRRSNIDAFTIAGVAHPSHAARAVRWVSIFAQDPKNRGVTYTNKELLAYYENDLKRSRLDRALTLGIQIEKASIRMGKGYKIPSGPMTAMLYYMLEISPSEAEDYAEMLTKGSRLPAKAVYARIVKARSDSGGRIHEVFQNAMIVKGWNALRAKRALRRGELEFSVSTDKFPEMI